MAEPFTTGTGCIFVVVVCNMNLHGNWLCDYVPAFVIATYRTCNCCTFMYNKKRIKNDKSELKLLYDVRIGSVNDGEGYEQRAAVGLNWYGKWRRGQ